MALQNLANGRADFQKPATVFVKMPWRKSARRRPGKIFPVTRNFLPGTRTFLPPARRSPARFQALIPDLPALGKGFSRLFKAATMSGNGFVMLESHFSKLGKKKPALGNRPPMPGNDAVTLRRPPQPWETVLQPWETISQYWEMIPQHREMSAQHRETARPGRFP